MYNGGIVIHNFIIAIMWCKRNQDMIQNLYTLHCRFFRQLCKSFFLKWKPFVDIMCAKNCNFLKIKKIFIKFLFISEYFPTLTFSCKSVFQYSPKTIIRSQYTSSILLQKTTQNSALISYPRYVVILVFPLSSMIGRSWTLTSSVVYSTRDFSRCL